MACADLRTEGNLLAMSIEDSLRFLRSLSQAESGSVIYQETLDDVLGEIDRLRARVGTLEAMLTDLQDHLDLLCMCGHEDAGGEPITPDRCWGCKIALALAFS